jgi:tetratricopeptide (TPR) repeat protein
VRQDVEHGWGEPQRRAAVFCFSLLSLLLLAAPLRADIVKAREAMQQSRFADAAEAYRAVIRTQKNNMEALTGLSDALYSLALYDDIVNFFPEEIRKGNIDLNQRSPEVMAILKNIGFACYQGGQSKKSIVALSIAVKIRDDDPSVYNTLGLAYLKIGSFRLAEIAFQVAVNLEPTSPFYVNNLGAAYLEQGMFREALIAFEKSVRLDRNYHNGWGNIWFSREKIGLPIHRGEYWYYYFLTATDDERLAHQRFVEEERRKQEAASAYKKQQERQEEERRLAAAEQLRLQQQQQQQQQEEAQRLGTEGGDTSTERPVQNPQNGDAGQQQLQDTGTGTTAGGQPDAPSGGE